MRRWQRPLLNWQTAAMANNSYKIQEVRALIKKMILDMGAVQA